MPWQIVNQALSYSSDSLNDKFMIMEYNKFQNAIPRLTTGKKDDYTQ